MTKCALTPFTDPLYEPTRRPSWTRPAWRTLVGDGLLGSAIRAKTPHQRGICGPISKRFGVSWGGVNLLAILATVGILKLVAFEFDPGVRRGLNSYPWATAIHHEEN